MQKVKGVYDGSKIVLLDPVSIPPHTQVEVLIGDDDADPEQIYWRRLLELGLIKEVRHRRLVEAPYEPVHATGTPVSEVVIRERR